MRATGTQPAAVHDDGGAHGRGGADEHLGGAVPVPGAEPRIRLVMADDDPGFVGAYRRFFDSVADLDLVGTASTGEGLVERVTALRPDVLLLDVEMPGTNGIDVIRGIRELGTGTRVVMLTAFDHDEYVHRAMGHGASGFLLKNATPAQILSAVRSVHAGYTSVASDVAGRLLPRPGGAARAPQPTDDGGPAFTQQQARICELLAVGRTSEEIASELHLSAETVRTYLRRMFHKFDVRNRTQLVAAAYRAGILR